jgi:hypothetical protein
MATPAEAQPALSSPSLGARERADRFCRSFGLRMPILQAPMAGACPASLASAVANAGGMGGLGPSTRQLANGRRLARRVSPAEIQMAQTVWCPLADSLA